MRFPNLVLGSLFLIISLQPLSAQTATAKTQTNTGPGKTNKFDLAQASGFDFGQVSNLSRGNGMISLSPPFVVRKAQDVTASSNNDLCYTMRVYNFKRQDGDAPEMTGSTTCTPANRANPRSIEGTPPKARYVPQ